MAKTTDRPRVRFLTFGCRVNQYETQAMWRHLSSDFDLSSGEADLYLVSACTVTALAEKKARQAIRRLRREHPEAKVVLLGCLADAALQGLTEMDDVDFLAGNAWKGRISELARRALAGERGRVAGIAPSPLEEERAERDSRKVRAFLKVQDGCDLLCTFCRTRQVRGPSRSKAICAAVEEARALVAAGCPEVVLSGINLAQYRREEGDLADLVRAILTIGGLRRLRLGSINAYGVTEEVLQAFACDDRACPHFHIPLQSGDDAVLRRMGRGYTATDYLATAERVRRAIPEATLGADVIVGFPGEDEAAFARTCGLVEEVEFANLHVFRYSPRKGTAAAILPHPVPEWTKRERAERLEELATRVRWEVFEGLLGGKEKVLVEERVDGMWRGYTRGYLNVQFRADGPVTIGQEVAVRIGGAVGDHLEGVSDDRAGVR
jgi:threonylcarbamoyladenosine tRNA methylthiotransferase MtaB